MNILEKVRVTQIIMGVMPISFMEMKTHVATTDAYAKCCICLHNYTQSSKTNNELYN